MSIVAVDMAAKYSGAVILDDDGSIIDQADSWQLSEFEFLEWIIEPWRAVSNYTTLSKIKWLTAPDVLVIEDLPHGVFSGRNTNPVNVKKVCRLQGQIEEKMNRYFSKDKILYVAPAVWLRAYGIKTTKDAAKLVQPMAESLGFVAPIDYTKLHGKDRQIARKVNTDHAAAMLLGLWAHNYYKEHGTYDSPETSRVI